MHRAALRCCVWVYDNASAGPATPQAKGSPRHVLSWAGEASASSQLQIQVQRCSETTRSFSQELVLDKPRCDQLEKHPKPLAISFRNSSGRRLRCRKI